MSKRPSEISDDEIRVIHSSQEESKGRPKRSSRRKSLIWLVIAIVIAAIAAIAYFLFAYEKNSVADNQGVSLTEPTITIQEDASVAESNGYIVVRDTIINDIQLKLLTPKNLKPSLYIGNDILNDSSVIMAFMAADIRRDNGQIVGAYVVDGDLVSKGQSKAGFCAIINDKLSVGVADATSMLEQAIENNGYFFRQYPLVVGGQLVENKPKGTSQRKALAEINGEIVVVLTTDRLTFHDFSQCLVDLGASNAIYLVGSTAYGFAKDSNGDILEFGIPTDKVPQNSNYIVWR